MPNMNIKIPNITRYQIKKWNKIFKYSIVLIKSAIAKHSNIVQVKIL